MDIDIGKWMGNEASCLLTTITSTGTYTTLPVAWGKISFDGPVFDRRLSLGTQAERADGHIDVDTCR